MYTVICCNAYYLVGRYRTAAEAEQAARHHVDGTFDCMILDGRGRIVGDGVDGITGSSPDGPPPYDAATATGMYDGW